MSDSNFSTPSAYSSGPRRTSEPDFAELKAERSLKDVLKKPSTVISIVLGVAVIGLVVWLQQRAIWTDLPSPTVSYEILRNEGLTEGLPILIKLNQVAVFQISDPLGGGGGAVRAKEIVESLEGAIADLEEEPGREITLSKRGDLPAIVQFASDGTGRRVIIELTADDVILAGMGSGKGVARLWAERLTDSLKVLMFAEAPEFTTGSEFGDALVTMFLGARGERGEISEASLDESFEELGAAQKLVLAALPPRSEPSDDEEIDPAP